jgi:hypothetical protein
MPVIARILCPGDPQRLRLIDSRQTDRQALISPKSIETMCESPDRSWAPLPDVGKQSFAPCGDRRLFGGESSRQWSPASRLTAPLPTLRHRPRTQGSHGRRFQPREHLERNAVRSLGPPVGTHLQAFYLRMHEAPLRLRSDKPQVHDLPGALASCLLIGRFRVFVWFSDEVPGGVICARGRPGRKDCSPLSVAAGHVRAEADFAQRSAGHAPDHRRCLRHEHRLRSRRDHGEAGERAARTDPGARRTAAT